MSSTPSAVPAPPTGSDAGARALLKRLGIAQVDSLPALLETLKLLHFTGPLPSNRIVSMSCSGGEASLMAAVQPAETDYVFFVADGSGGHAFAETLDEHNRNVARWREIEAQQQNQ